MLFRRLRAAQGRHAGQYAESIHQIIAVGGIGAFFQCFTLVVGGEGEAEFVGKAEAVAEVEAVADDVGTLPRAGNDDAVGMFDVVAFLIQLLLQFGQIHHFADLVGLVGHHIFIGGRDGVVAARMPHPAVGNRTVVFIVFCQLAGDFVGRVFYHAQHFFMGSRRTVGVRRHRAFAAFPPQVRRRFFAYVAPVPKVVLIVGRNDADDGAAALMAVAVGLHPPHIGLKVYPFVVLRFPFVADFVGFAVDFRAYARCLLRGFV